MMTDTQQKKSHINVKPIQYYCSNWCLKYDIIVNIP